MVGRQPRGCAVSEPAGPRNKFPLRLAQLQPAAKTPTPKLLRPQRLVHEAAQGQARASMPSGIGLDSGHVRERMVHRLQADGLKDPRVIAALRAVPRHLFVDSALVPQAYEDTSLPIGLGQTISKPSVVARMLELLIATQPITSAQKPRLLEIGTGCGYQAALLAQLGRFVVSIERLKPLHDRARENLSALALSHLRLVYGDGRIGHAPNAPFDGIIAAAGGDDLPPAWIDQLAPGGRLVAPMIDDARCGQVLVVIDRQMDGRLHRSVHEAVKFVPLKSGLA